MRTENVVAQESAGVWKKTSKQYLFLHNPSGIYYLRVRLGGKNAHRESLKTKDFKTALARRASRLAELNARRPAKATDAPQTLWDALCRVKAQVERDPSLKAGSRDAYDDVIRSLCPFAPPPDSKQAAPAVPVPITPLRALTAAEMETWWKRTAAYYAPSRANYQLLFVQRALRLAQDAGALTRDAGVNLARVRVPRTRLKLITKDQFSALVAAVAAQVNGKPAAEWIEFVAYTGTRPNEANCVLWEDVNREQGFVTITGGARLTKNSDQRKVPIVPALADLLERIQKRTGATSGRVLSIRHPRYTLPHACEAIGIPRLKRYDFRHLFATRCNESGADIPTIAKWLGHKDGGKLALKTYVHVHADHELRVAAQIKF